jgi:hypothetical protein
MSVMGTAARTIPLRVPETTPVAVPRRILRLVPQRRSAAARTPFAVVLVVLLVGGLLGLLLLNMLVAQNSFALHDLAKNARTMTQQEQALAGQVDALQAPAQLASSAEHLGMVPGGPPVFLRLSDGKVLGTATKGEALPKPAPKPSAAAVAGKRAAPSGSTTWTAPRQSPPPTTTTGAHR